MNEDILPFCDSDWPRCQQPFDYDGFTYATDGRIVVRVPARGFPGNPHPRLNPWLLGWSDAGDWRPLPKLVEMKIEPCELCDDARDVPGTIFGSPDVPCGQCLVSLDGKLFARHYILKMLSLSGELEYQLRPVTTKAGEEMTALHFRWPGGRGILMAVIERQVQP